MEFYFTYGTHSSFPFCGGWTLVNADSKDNAINIFNIYHPSCKNNTVNCAGIYTKEEFYDTKMWYKGNYGAMCHEIINCNREIMRANPKYKYEVLVIENGIIDSIMECSNEFQLIQIIENENGFEKPNRHIEIRLI